MVHELVLRVRGNPVPRKPSQFHSEYAMYSPLVLFHGIEIFEHLIPLPKFKDPLPKYNSYYEAVKDLIIKIAGDDDQVRVKSLLES